MPTIQQHLTVVKEHDKKFAGTIAFRNEKLTLPDGSKVAIGIDSERWVILYQRTPSAPFVMFEYNADNHMLLVDKVQGTDKEYKILSGILDYFFSHADVSDVVTIEVKRRG
ncbi:hypothetical protein ACFLZ2_00490 [Candidatus Margulisiibacteriota bacterium]